MGKVKKVEPKKVHKSKSGSFIESSIVKKVSPLKIKKPQKPIEKNVLSSTKSNLNLKQMKSKLEMKSPVNKTGHISKKNKIKEKRKSLINKIDLLQEAKKEVLAQKKRQRTAIIGDLMPLKDALPSLDSLFLLKQSLDIKTGVPEFDEEMEVPAEKSKNSLKKEQMRNVVKEHNKRLNYYQRLIADDTFKKNPREVIAAHIRNTKLFEEQADQFNNN